MLQIKVTVIAEDVERKARKEEALTLVVNAHGGLLKMKMEVQLGQPMLLVNSQNKVEQSCRVVRVEDTSPELFSVAFEFDHRTQVLAGRPFHPRIGMLRGRDAGQGNFSSPELAPSSPFDTRNFSKNSGFNIGMERRPLWRTLR